MVSRWNCKVWPVLVSMCQFSSAIAADITVLIAGMVIFYHAPVNTIKERRANCGMLSGTEYG